MANHHSAKRRHLQSLKRNARNRSARSELASQIKKARTEIASKDAQPNQGEVKKAQQIIAKSLRKGILHRKTAARKISRLMRQAHICKTNA